MYIKWYLYVYSTVVHVQFSCTEHGQYICTMNIYSSVVQCTMYMYTVPLNIYCTVYNTSAL